MVATLTNLIQTSRDSQEGFGMAAQAGEDVTNRAFQSAHDEKAGSPS
ncbi:MAG TPA: hypothetical protein VK886_22400 [Vicinamibacterales bacterium]|nr:hypothetical protein [Vicinamibacterales bacterium]